MIYYNDKDTTCGEPIAVLLGRKSIRSSRRSKLRATPFSEGRRTDAIDELLIKIVE